MTRGHMTRVIADISMSLDGFVTGPDPDGPGGWSAEMSYGAGLGGTPPFLVVTHSVPQHVRLGLSFTLVTDELRAAIEQAWAAAGGKDVS